MSTLTDQELRLADGRVLGYAEYGEPSGKPVFFFHGWPSSRLFLRSKADIATALGVRLIACERPGFGLSDFLPGRTLLDWPKDVTELADSLGIDRFSIAGHSGGGPYVAACAYKLAPRLNSAAIISGLAPLTIPGATDGMMFSNRLMFALAKRSPWLQRIVLALSTSGGPKKYLQGMLSSLPEFDKMILSSIEGGEEDIAEAFRGGVRGPALDQRLLASRWGFRLEDIPMPVDLWHGDQDVMVPIRHGRFLSERLRDCRAAFCRGEGHMLLLARWEEILVRLVSGGNG